MAGTLKLAFTSGRRTGVVETARFETDTPVGVNIGRAVRREAQGYLGLDLLEAGRLVGNVRCRSAGRPGLIFAPVMGSKHIGYEVRRAAIFNRHSAAPRRP